MEELTENAEEPDEGESKQSEQKLGKLKYKVRICPFIALLIVVINFDNYNFSLSMISTQTVYL